MDDEPSNAAVDFARRVVEVLNGGEEHLRRKLPSMLAPEFVRYDRRRVTPQPPADGEGWLATLVTLSELLGEGATYRLSEVIATRGDRLGMTHTMGGVPGATELEFIGVIQLDEALERVEVLVFFDPEDADLAITELDRRHLELLHR